MLTLQEWENTQSSKNCVFIKAHKQHPSFLFKEHTVGAILQLEKGKGRIPWLPNSDIPYVAMFWN